MEYLSHIIGNNGIQMDPKKIESMCEARLLKNWKELLPWVGLVLLAFHMQLLSCCESPVQAHE